MVVGVEQPKLTWSMMCFHEPGVLSSLVKMEYSSSLMAIMRCAMVLMSRFHSSKRAGSFKIKDT